MRHMRRQMRSFTCSRPMTSSVVTARHAQRQQQTRCTLLLNQCGIRSSLCTATSCCSTSTNLVDVKRSGLNKKRAASRFGEPRLQLSPSRNMPHKVKLAEGLVQPQRWSSDASMSGSKTEQKGEQAPDRTSSLRSRPTSRLRLHDSDTREELRDTMLLYNIPFVKDGTGASTDRPRNRLETLMPNGPDDRRYSAAGVLALSFGPPDGHIRLLLTQEKANKSRWRKKMVKRDFWRTMHPFNIPGGKRKIIDTDAKATALRELEEETAGLLTSSNVNLAQAATHFGPPSNYYAFSCRVEGQEDLPERFAALIADPPADIGACRTKALIWMPVRELARWPRSDFLDRLFNGTSIPAWLCAQQQEHDLRQEQRSRGAEEQPLLGDLP